MLGGELKMKGKKRYTIRKKLIITFIPLTLFALMIITLSSFLLYSKSFKNVHGKLINETLKQVNLHLDTYLNEIVRLTHSPYYNENIMAVLNKNVKGRGPNVVEESKIMDQELYSMLTTWREDIQGIYFYRNDGKKFSRSRYSLVMDHNSNYLTSDWYKDISNSRKEEFFINELNIDGIFNRPKRAFSVARSIYLYDDPSLAVLVIDINYTGLKNLINTVDFGDHSNIFIVDENNNIILSKDDKYFNTIGNIDFSDDNIQEFSSKDDSFISAFVDSNTTDWKIVGVVSKKDFFVEIALLQSLIIGISGVTIIIIIIACILFSYRITKPLSELNIIMKKMERGDYKTSMKVVSNDEIGDLANTFNQMKEHIDELIHEVLEVEYEKKEAELNNLKYQIRPHFLYNTLESIRALAEIHENIDIVEMSYSLGAFLRYSIKEHNNLVLLKEELYQVKNYIKIQQFRFGDISVTYDVPPKLSNCSVIPLILQPLVENAIQHGFIEKTSDRCLIIKVHIFQFQKLVIEIIDNGIGISPKLVNKLNNSLLKNDIDSSSFGIGLSNVDSRIKMTFGDSYGINIKSQPHLGTRVIISLPYIP